MTSATTAAVVVNDEAEGLVRQLLTSVAVRDPYPLFRQLREIAPVYRSESAGCWAVTDYDNCLEVVRSPSFGRGAGDEQLVRRNPRFATSANLQLSADMLPYIDPPQHTRLRRLVSRSFNPRRIESFRTYVADCLKTLLDAAETEEREQGSVDLVTGLSEQLPITVICEMLGVPHDDHANFMRWVHAVAQAIAGTEEALVAADDATECFVEYFAELAAERRARPTDDLFSDLVHTQEGSDEFSQNELSSMCLALIGGGAETTTALISNAVLGLYRNPSEATKLIRNPDLAAGAVEEVLRYDSPLQSTFPRLVLEDTRLGGFRIPKGDVVVPFIAAGNRDPAMFDDPDSLHIDRDRGNAQQLAFGGGIHLCLGMALARVEGQVAIPGIFQRFPELRVIDTEPEFRGNSMVRSVKRLRMQLSPA